MKALEKLNEILQSGLGVPLGTKFDTRDFSEEGLQKAVLRSKEKYKTLLLEKKGVQEFEIDGKKILARSYENAVKKAKKNG